MASPDELADQILSIADASARCAFLEARRSELTLQAVEALKARADESLLRDPTQSLRIAGIAQEAAALVADELAPAVALWAEGNAHFYRW